MTMPSTRLARIPAKGDSVPLGDWRVEVLDIEHHRADRLRLTAPAAPAAVPAPDGRPDERSDQQPDEPRREKQTEAAR
ncbi:Membrane protein OS=Streptomyces fumanus OX=67302 GN=GCM10018772_11510 PE=4 SV=1 [Streptomyces fumanus]